MSEFKNKAKSFVIGATLVPASMLAAGMIFSNGTGNSDTVHSSTFSLSHAFECAYSMTTPQSHKTYDISATDHGMDSSGTYPYAAHPLVTYPAMLGLGLLGVRGRWYDKIKEKCR